MGWEEVNQYKVMAYQKAWVSRGLLRSRQNVRGRTGKMTVEMDPHEFEEYPIHRVGL